MNVSLIATVKNEADNIVDLLVSMLRQTLPPDEIVINDNGSTDDTVTLIESFIRAGYPIRLVHGGHNIPSGRNHAIQHALSPIIASCDAGLTLPPHWLATITAPLLNGEADVVGGFYEPDPRSLWEVALGAANYPDVAEVDPATFLPAGQSMAFTKQAWATVGGYPEWADTCEDLIFDQALQQHGFRFRFAPAAAVRFRPRSTPQAYVRQYFTYARGDGQANLWPRRHAIRYATYIGLGLVIWLARCWHRAVLLLLPPAIAIYLHKPVRRAWLRTQTFTLPDRALVLLLLPVIRLLGDVAKLLGYPVGLWRRVRWQSEEQYG
ncbi:MAG: glycosyltransferase [Herpetosiphonaceae bacterium]|nr:glycosyltransferase [Herpetosiphonaceae bacterium]